MSSLRRAQINSDEDCRCLSALQAIPLWILEGASRPGSTSKPSPRSRIQMAAGGPLVLLVTKESAGTQLVGAIRKVASGRPYISTEVAEQLALNIMAPNEQLLHKQLSDREFEVFSLLVGGKSITEIANNLHLSVKTVSTHKTRIMQKMGMTSLSEMVQYAVAHRLLSPLKA